MKPISLPPSTIESYIISVQELKNLYKTGAESELESTLLKALNLRDEVEEFINHHAKLDFVELDALLKADNALCEYGRYMVRKRDISPEKWRYLMPERDWGWWWQLDKNLVRRNNQVTVESSIPMALVAGIVIFGFSFGLVLMTTQQFWSKGLDWVGYFNLIAQGIVGGGLLTELGQKTALQAVRDGLKLFGVFRRKSRSPLNEQRDNNLGVLAASSIFFFMTLGLTILVFPWGARQMHNLSVQAIKRQDMASAQIFLDLAIQLQPDILRIFYTDVTVELTQLGNLYLEAGNVEKAQEMYERALENDSANVTVHYLLADIYIKQGQSMRAITLLDSAINLIRAHQKGEYQLPFKDPDQVKELLYLSLVTRARAFYEEFGPEASFADLVEAQYLVEDKNNIHIFTSPANTDTGRVTSELYVLLGRYYTHTYYNGQCDTGTRSKAMSSWYQVLAVPPSPRVSVQRLWRDEADEQRERLMQVECESA